VARQEDLIWAAGFIDGESCISIQRQERYDSVYFYMSMKVFQNDPRPLVDLTELFGGTIAQEGNGQSWRLGGPAAAEALKELLPYLRVKREQAEVAISFQSRRFPVGSNRPKDFSIEEDERDWLRAKHLKRVV